MDAIFAENKGTLLSLFHSLEAEEAGLERLTTGTHLDEGQIFRQINKVTEARAALEKANVHMLLGIRKQMTDQQVEKLDEHRPTSQRRGPPHHQPDDFDKPDGQR